MAYDEACPILADPAATKCERCISAVMPYLKLRVEFLNLGDPTSNIKELASDRLRAIAESIPSLKLVRGAEDYDCDTFRKYLRNAADRVALTFSKKTN